MTNEISDAAVLDWYHRRATRSARDRIAHFTREAAGAAEVMATKYLRQDDLILLGGQFRVRVHERGRFYTERRPVLDGVRVDIAASGGAVRYRNMWVSGGSFLRAVEPLPLREWCVVLQQSGGTFVSRMPSKCGPLRPTGV
ncbi:hypothetical protein AB0G79_20150 [Streptomyces sp. NPDC020807]|uniref:hypothetical protein n=1 Tax=Streptomyces sp. NPDC020807 TaxID=3155119 RepID=UPI0034023871